jgi:envelope integrity protein B
MTRGIFFFTCAAITAAVVVQQPAKAAQIIPLAAHRAIYELTLDPGKNTTRVDSARGRIAYEMRGNACDGYSVNLRQVTELDTGEGKQTTSDLRSATWEDSDSKNFRFKNENYVDRQLRDEVDGTASRLDDGSLQVKLGGKAKVSGPMKFGGPILLPTEQIFKILQAGDTGGHLLEASVFDGTPDGQKIYRTLSVIGGGKTGGDTAVEEAARVPELSKIKRFPVTVSYFDSKTKGEETPAYTLAFELYENGVSRALRLDYGNFALKGELKSIEFFKQAPCQK